MLHSYGKGGRGFTIVELLIVIVVIGILAAIVIVAFNGVQNRAYNTTVQGDLAAIGRKLQIYKINSTNDSYPASAAQLPAVDLSVTRNAYDTSRNNIYYCVSTDGKRYAVVAAAKSGQAYTYVDGGLSAVALSTISSMNTCELVGRTSTYAQGAGFDFSGGGGWASWLK